MESSKKFNFTELSSLFKLMKTQRCVEIGVSNFIEFVDQHCDNQLHKKTFGEKNVLSNKQYPPIKIKPNRNKV